MSQGVASPARAATRGEFHSGASPQARLYYQTPAVPNTFSVGAAKEADRAALEKRIQKDLAQVAVQTQEKAILQNYVAHHAGHGGSQEMKESMTTAAFSSPLAQDYSDLLPDSLSLRSPLSPSNATSSSSANRDVSPARSFKPGRCAIAGCSYDSVATTAGGRGFCSIHAQASANDMPIRVIVKGGQTNTGSTRSISPSRVPTTNFLTASLAPSPLQTTVAAAAIGITTPFFPPVGLNTSGGQMAMQPPMSPSRTQIIQAQYGQNAAGRTDSNKGAEEIQSFLQGSASTSSLGGSPFKLSSSRMSGPLIQYSMEDSLTKVITPRTAAKIGKHAPTPPSSTSVISPIRSLRTPAGLALSYEHGRNIKGLRKEVLYKSGQMIHGEATAQLQQSQGQQGPPLIPHVHSTPLQPLQIPPSALVQTSLTATLNRVASPPAHDPSTGTSSSNRPASSSQLTPLAPQSSAASASTASSNATIKSPFKPDTALHEKPMTAVQRQRAYRAALLSKALSKPSSVQSLDRSRMEQLTRLLRNRSSILDLLKKKIVLEEQEVAKLKQQLHGTKQNLAHLLQTRPSVESLTNKNIIKTKETIESRAQSKSALGAFLAHRPSVTEVQAKFGDKGFKLPLEGLIEDERSAAQKEPTGNDAIADAAGGAKPTSDILTIPTNRSGAATDRSEGGSDQMDEDELEAHDAMPTLPIQQQFRKFPGALSNASSAPSAATKLAPGRRKFSVFTSVKLATQAEKTLDKLSNFLEHRPPFEELMKKNIMMSKPGSNFHSNPSLAANARKMSFSNLRNNVSRLLQTRPTMKDLKTMAKSLLGSMVKNQMEQVKEHEATENEMAEVALAQLDAKNADSKSPADGTPAPDAPAPTISLESLASGNLKIDEILAQKRRIAEQKLKLRAKEPEEPGGIYMLGANEYGQTGFMGDMEYIPTLTHLKPLLREIIVQVACGFEHTLVRTETGFCYVYGKNSYGQLGLGDTQARDQPYSTHFRGSPLFKKICIYISAYDATSALVTKDGEVYTMGSLKTGALGFGDPNTTDETKLCVSTPTSIPELKGKNIQKISLGGTHGGALDGKGRLYTWGRNDLGQLGNNNYVDKYKPSLIEGYGEFWSDVNCGENHMGAIGFDNNTYLWGSNRNGQLGFHSSPEWNSPQPAPKVVMSLFRKGVSKISCSRHHTVALSEDGEIYTTFIIDHTKFIEKCKFHRLKPRLHIKDVIATPIDHIIAIDLSGIMYTWEPNALDDPKVDDSLETRHLHELASGLEHVAVIGTINKSWRVQAVEAAQQAAAQANAKTK